MIFWKKDDSNYEELSIALLISRLLLRLFVSVSRVEEEYDDYGGIDYIAIVDVVEHEMTWQFLTNIFNNSSAFPEEIPEQRFLSNFLEMS